MRKTLLTKKAEKRGKVTPKLTSTVTAACLLFGSFTNIFAQTAFDSNLKTVSISDAAITNLPPTAKLKYIKESDTFSFDASGSFDSDGYIKEYIWDLGDGTKATGITVSHKYANTALPVVTLTATDNSQNDGDVLPRPGRAGQEEPGQGQQGRARVSPMCHGTAPPVSGQ